MAIPNTSFHIRSLSFPSAPHPLDASIENHLRKLSGSQAGPSSSSSICQNLCSIKELYEQMNELIHLPHNQMSLSRDLLRQEVEAGLDGSLVLLDISSSALDALSQMKESILDLQSAFRRGSNDEGIHAYLVSRKKIIKTVFKCLVNLKKAEKTCALAQPENKEFTVKMLKEAEAISLLTLKSMLSYVMGKKAMSQTRSWSLVAKLVKSKNSSHDAENATEVEEIDRSLSTLTGAETKSVLKQLETLELAINELQDGMESVSRCFVKTRVSLLNVLNN